MNIIKSLEYTNFRNHKKAKWEFSSQNNLIVGNNGAGKTNILEGVYFLSIGKSFRAVTEKDVINIESSFSKITAYVNDSIKLEIELQRNYNGRVKKVFKKNGVIKKAKDFIGLFRSVLFNPEDIRLIIGSPSRRRDYIDTTLCQLYPEYYKNLHKYERVLKHRNKLLEISRGQILHNIYEAQLELWDKELSEAGIIVQDYRKKFFEYVDESIMAISDELFGEIGLIKIEYVPSLINLHSLSSKRRFDIESGHTSVGPHRDDFNFSLIKNNLTMDLQNFGSRGQQRTAVLALKIIELNYMEKITNTKPVLLLDDIFSELDDIFREHVNNTMQKYQTIVTSAEKVDTSRFEKIVEM